MMIIASALLSITALGILILLISKHRKYTFYIIWTFISKRANKEFEPVKKLLFAECGEISGHVVEIGPGFGETFQYYIRDPHSISSLTLLEPNVHMHPRLTQAALSSGVPFDKLRLVSLEAGSCAIPIPDGQADVVICTLVLCSVKDQAATLAEIRRILRPGGRFAFLEHVAAPGGFAALAQRALSSTGLWTLCGDGCELRRRTGEAVVQAGGWAACRITACRGPSPWLPAVYGVAVRSSGVP